MRVNDGKPRPPGGRRYGPFVLAARVPRPHYSAHTVDVLVNRLTLPTGTRLGLAIHNNLNTAAENWRMQHARGS